MSYLSHVRARAREYAAYHRTKRELRNLPVERAIEDLGIYPGDAKEIASKAVWG